jgi:hypothetical protein
VSSGKARRSARGGAAPKASAPAARVKWARGAVLGIAGALSYLLLAGWDSMLPVVLVPLIVGASIGLCSKSSLEALAAGGFAGVAGPVAASALYAQAFLQKALSGMPRWANQDVPSSFYQDMVFPLLSRNPFLGVGSAAGGVAAAVVAAVLLVPLSAWLVRMLDRTRTPKVARLTAAWAIVGILSISLFYTAYEANAAWMSRLDAEPAVGSYAYDGIMNLKVYYLMQGGMGFYEAYTAGHAGDSRYAPLVKDGRFITGSAAGMRQPAMFYLWKVVAPGRRGNLIAVAAFVAAALVLLGSFWALWPVAGYRALFVVPALFPALVMHSANVNPLFPEWWAGVLLLLSFFALARGHRLSAGALGLAAMVFRETTGVWLVALILVSVVLAFRDKERWKAAGVYAGLLAVGLLAFYLHVRSGSAYVTTPVTGSIIGSILAPRELTRGLLAPMAYLMVPYGFLRLSTLWLIPVGMVGLWVGLARRRTARIAVTLYCGLFLTYFATVGASSQYWGQLVTLQLLIGAALLVVSLDRLADRASWAVSLSGGEEPGADPPEPESGKRGQGARKR